MNNSKSIAEIFICEIISDIGVPKSRRVGVWACREQTTAWGSKMGCYLGQS